jgi:hypothetical protein
MRHATNATQPAVARLLLLLLTGPPSAPATASAPVAAGVLGTETATVVAAADHRCACRLALGLGEQR